MEWLVIAVILFVIFIANNFIKPNEIIKETQPIFKVLMENDYEFLLKLKYGQDVDVNEAFSVRLRNAFLLTIVLLFLLLKDLNFVKVLFLIIIWFAVYKGPYTQLRAYYKRNLHHINLMLPYYLKSLEILIQHYTVPVALSKSIDKAPEVFKPGLRTLVKQIEAGDMTVEPYMEFARTYPVRDSMRMMRLLYRLSLGNQDKKQEQLMMFSKTVSNLQNKSRELKYAERLNAMEQRTMVMLFVTGGGIMLVLFLSMFMLMNI